MPGGWSATAAAGCWHAEDGPFRPVNQSTTEAGQPGASYMGLTAAQLQNGEALPTACVAPLYAYQTAVRDKYTQAHMFCPPTGLLLYG
jgi:hypothetical protein